MSELVLSLFPGVGILDAAFEAEGFCVVRGPDLLWGGDIRRFHPPRDRFDGIIGGPPCQAFSTLQYLLEHGRQQGRVYKRAPNLIPEFERCVSEAAPNWFLMENIRRSPAASVRGYDVHAFYFNNRWIGGVQSRLHRFSFGTRDGCRCNTAPEETAFEAIDYSPRVLASGGVWRPVRLGGSKKRKKVRGGGYLRRPEHVVLSIGGAPPAATRRLGSAGLHRSREDSRARQCGAVPHGPRPCAFRAAIAWAADRPCRSRSATRSSGEGIVSLAAIAS